MFKMPLTDIIQKIQEKSSLSEAEINSKIDEKLDLLSGLISKEGAAHIVANELGIKLFEQTGGKLQIKNILAGMRDVETVGKIQRKNNISEFQRKDGSLGKVGSILIADETGSIRVVLWGDQTNILEKAKEGDIVKVISGYVRENRGFKEIHMNDRSKLMINPDGESVGEVKASASSRKNIKELTENDINVEVFATIVQVFDLRFFEVCPKCGKRARKREDSFVCDTHNKVNPNYSYVLNLILDDGTETIRTVFFRNNVDSLLKMGPDNVLAIRENSEGFEKIKNDLLGEQIKVQGRVNKNEMFDRLELMARQVNPTPDPQKEIDRMQSASQDAV